MTTNADCSGDASPDVCYTAVDLAGMGLAPGSAGCVDDPGPTTVRCLTAGINLVSATLADGNDVASVTAPLSASFSGGTGNDILNGGPVGDTLAGDDGADVLGGGPGNDELEGHDGEDTLRGDAGDDVLRGEANDDGLKGGADDDELSGDRGEDRICGEGGNDTMGGGIGIDYLGGGPGQDVARGGFEVPFAGAVANDHCAAEERHDCEDPLPEPLYQCPVA